MLTLILIIMRISQFASQLGATSAILLDHVSPTGYGCVALKRDKIVLEFLTISQRETTTLHALSEAELNEELPRVRVTEVVKENGTKFYMAVSHASAENLRGKEVTF